MDSHPKVMTVSYGTFTCTLDGFNDPFTTMQLVAEYFRKLSADDRYFGGEPLQPDASKLHQIAKSANPNRIDADVSDNSVVLREADVIDASPNPEASVALGKDDDLQDPSDAKPRPSSEDPDKQTAFSSRRATTEVLATSLNEAINDTATAEQLSPSLEEDIPSETISAAVKALKSGEAIDRWLETTNEKMTTPEHLSKANALERLKAAVAATEAERSIRMRDMTTTVTETGEERRGSSVSFRRELAKVRKAHEREADMYARTKVTPPEASKKAKPAKPLLLDTTKRVEPPQSGGEQKKPAASANKNGLKLVPNTPAPSDDGKTAETQATQKPSKQGLPSFSEFARLMGASTLIELLEASAAYMTLVHGKDYYSGKQITANLPTHIKKIVKAQECVGALDRLYKRGFVEAGEDGKYKISMGRKAAYQKKYLAS